MKSTRFMPWGLVSRGLIPCLLLLLLPSFTQAATSSWVRSVALITGVSRVLVDQPTGTTFATGTGGLMYVLSGATATAPTWFAPGPAGAPTGAMYALNDGQGHVLFNWGHGLDLLAPTGTPLPVPHLHAPLWPFDMVVADGPAHRLFEILHPTLPWVVARDSITGTSAFTTTLPIAKTSAPASYTVTTVLGVDPIGGLLYVGGYIGDSSTVITHGGAGWYLHGEYYLVGIRDGRIHGSLETSAPPNQVIVAASARRLVSFSCPNGSGEFFLGDYASAYIQILDLTTHRWLTPQPVPVSSCWSGTGVAAYNAGSGLNLPYASTEQLPAVDASADRVIIVSPSTQGDQYEQQTAGQVKLIDLRTASMVGCVQVGTFPDAVAIDSSRHRAFIANGMDGTVTVLDTRSGQVLAVVPVGGAPSSVAVDRRDQLVYVATGSLVYFPENYQNTQKPPTIPC
jgi:YVTN family beta-propeller protein